MLKQYSKKALAIRHSRVCLRLGERESLLNNYKIFSKKWVRKWKEDLIIENNPEWKDLSLKWF